MILGSMHERKYIKSVQRNSWHVKIPIECKKNK